MLYPQLRERRADLLEQVRLIEKQTAIFKGIKKGDLIYSEYHRVSVARQGVQSWILSNSPSILKCISWGYNENDYAISFQIIATEDPVPYNFPYDIQYSGKDARIILPNENSHATEVMQKVRKITDTDLPLFINYYHKTDLFSKFFR